MSIYSKKSHYRKIYEQHYGPIPKDENGRSYEIHHIDGDNTNNDPANLKAVSIQEHYEIHLAQGDWHACLLISARMNQSPEEKSRLAQLAAQQRVQEGAHHWMGDNNPARRAVKAGTHPWLDPNFPETNRQRQLDKMANGSHNFVTNNPTYARVESGEHGKISREHNLKRVQAGTHHFVTDNPVHKRIADGTHNFLNQHSVYAQLANGTHAFKGKDVQKRLLAEGKHPTQVKITCPHCGLTGAKPVMTRFHMDNCKVKPK